MKQHKIFEVRNGEPGNRSELLASVRRVVGAVRLGCLRFGKVVAHGGLLLFQTCPEVEFENA